MTLCNERGSPITPPFSKEVVQSSLGRLRQEYVDIPKPSGIVPVPGVEVFTQDHPDCKCPDSEWCIVSPWVLETKDAFIQAAEQAGLPMKGEPTSVYRSPVWNANVYLEMGKAVNWHYHRHLLGEAIDYAVLDSNHDANVDEHDYDPLVDVALDFGDVEWEYVFNHVHVQEP